MSRPRKNAEALEFPAQEAELLGFQNKIEELVTTHNISFLEALMEVCQKENVDSEVVRGLISPALMHRLEEDARKLRLIDGEENFIDFSDS